MRKDFYNNEPKNVWDDLPWLIEAPEPEADLVAVGPVAMTAKDFRSFSDSIVAQLQAMQRQNNAGAVAAGAVQNAILSRLDALEIAAAAGPVAIAAPLPFNVGFPPLASISNLVH